MTVYSYILSMFVVCISYLMYYRYLNVYVSVITKPEKRYDYIIVGAGTTGCVLASRLSENPEVKVLLIEAGDHMSYFTKIPMTPTVAQKGPNDWSVTTVAQKYSSFGMWGQSQIIPRGKGLGGSGQINFLLHGFGLAEDYDRWSNFGFQSWTLEYLKPYFIRAFGTVRSEFDSEHCSLNGFCPGSKVPMKLKLIDEENELLKVFKRASNLISGRRTIFRKPTATIKDGARVSTLDAYLKPALNRRNLHVLLNTQAVSIRFENLTASSIYILKNNMELDNIFMNREIILSAGAIKTPQLLIMSGIGPRDLIQRLRIKLVSENDNVGKNLHDHTNIPIFVSIKKPISVTLSKIFTIKTVWDYFWYKRGLLSFPPVAGLEYHNSSALMLFAMGTASERLLRDLSNYKPKVFRDTFPFYNDMSKEGFMFLATCTQPRSRGTVTLKDSSVSIQPMVDPNYLHQHWDVKCMIRAIRRAELLIASKPFQDIGARIHWPRPERCLSFWRYPKEEYTDSEKNRKRKVKQPYIQYSNQTSPPKESKSYKNSPPDDYLECIIRELAVTGHHIGGTCAGGAVVDDQLRVKSVSRLRIMDASVLPSPISLYPNSVLTAMAEKAADIIQKSVN